MTEDNKWFIRLAIMIILITLILNLAMRVKAAEIIIEEPMPVLELGYKLHLPWLESDLHLGLGPAPVYSPTK